MFEVAHETEAEAAPSTVHQIHKHSWWKTCQHVGLGQLARGIEPPTVVYKLDPTESDQTQQELTQGKSEESEKPSS